MNVATTCGTIIAHYYSKLDVCVKLG